ncbi:MAG: response regulator [Chitinivibrionales bacterium]|nr:response regulator [Chitinivibrionales bacterium]
MMLYSTVIEQEDAVCMNSKPLEVLVVDDEVQITELIEIFIKSAGPEAVVHSFNDALQAREFIASQKKSIDVLITDYKMPNVNGIELLELANPEIKKILISGYVSEIAMDKLEQLNAFFFEKPVPMKELSKVVFDNQVDSGPQ